MTNALMPERIGPYRIDRELGRGGMGVVFLGVHEQTGEQVAVKTVHTPSPAALTSIRRELRALARLRHPGIVQARDSGSTAGVPWCAMQFLDGKALSTYIAELWPRREPGWRSNPTLDLDREVPGVAPPRRRRRAQCCRPVASRS